MKKLLLMFVTGVMASVAVGAEAEPFKAVLTQAGELSAVLGDQVNVIDAVEVEGPMNEADFHTLCLAGYCGNLRSVDLSGAQPEGNVIPAQAFWIDLKSTPVEGARQRSLISTVILPEQVTEIGILAFNDLQLKNLQWPTSLKTIGKAAFANSIDAEIEVLALPAEVETIGEDAFTYSNAKRVVLPESIKHIGGQAFSSSKVEEINLPEGLETIGEHAFFWTNLKSVSIPASVTSLGSGAFSWCQELKEAVLPEGMTSVPAELFSGCENLVSVNMPSTVVSIGESAFSACPAIESMTLPEGLASIGRNTFFRCNFKTLDIRCADDVVKPQMFAGMDRLESVTIPDSWEQLREGLFMNCGLREVTLPAQLKTVDKEAFMGCVNLTSVTLPEGLESVGESAFSYCRLQKLELPASVTSLAAGSFALGVWGDVYSLNPVPPVCDDQNMLMGAYGNTLYVPVGSKDAYAGAYGWELFNNIAEYDPSAIGDIAADGDAAVKVSGGAIVVSGGAFEVYTADGRLVAGGMADGETQVAATPGIYVVRVGDTTAKVAL